MKVKISITIDEDVLDGINHIIADNPSLKRSQVISICLRNYFKGMSFKKQGLLNMKMKKAS